MSFVALGMVIDQIKRLLSGWDLRLGSQISTALWSDFQSAEHLSAPMAFSGTCWAVAATDSTTTWVNAKIPAPAPCLQQHPYAREESGTCFRSWLIYTVY